MKYMETNKRNRIAESRERFLAHQIIEDELSTAEQKQVKYDLMMDTFIGCHRSFKKEILEDFIKVFNNEDYDYER